MCACMCVCVCFYDCVCLYLAYHGAPSFYQGASHFPGPDQYCNLINYIPVLQHRCVWHKAAGNETRHEYRTDVHIGNPVMDTLCVDRRDRPPSVWSGEIGQLCTQCTILEKREMASFFQSGCWKSHFSIIHLADTFIQRILHHRSCMQLLYPLIRFLENKPRATGVRLALSIRGAVST